MKINVQFNYLYQVKFNKTFITKCINLIKGRLDVYINKTCHAVEACTPNYLTPVMSGHAPTPYDNLECTCMPLNV